ncbi:MAG: PQQ-dependent sugar dehydrogenase [Opitutaceae bacterium]|nr:PQQ-dependent sugar dehydrogenase [Opitutaceae bacterium]
MKTLPLIAIFLLALPLARAALPVPDADNGGITLPPGFRALVVADKLKPLRQVAVAPNGDLYAKTREGGIYALRDTDGDGRADVIKEFGNGGGTGIALRGEWLYHSSNNAIYRYKLAPGELVPAGNPERIVKDLPDRRQHAAKAFAFGADGRLYVEVGSPSNALGQPDRARGAIGQDPTEFLKTHGGYWSFAADQPDQTQADGRHFSTGHRHSTTIALNPANGRLFIAIHGRDQLSTVAPQFFSDDDNAELPAEVLHELTEGANFGWPTTYWDPHKHQRMLNPEYGGDGRKAAPAGKFPDPLVAFPAHWSPMQLAFYTGTQFPEKYRGGAFLAFQGSWNRAPRPQKGYNVVFIPFNASGLPAGGYEVFADNFTGKAELASPNDAAHRPHGVAVGPDGSLYVTDALHGRIWRILHTGETK